MSVGIVTILKVDNYGADLQAFALQRKLELMGYDSRIIDYLYYKNGAYQREKASKVCFQYPFKFVIREKILEIRDFLYHCRYRSSYRIRSSEFQEFHLHNTKMTRCYNSYSDLYNDPPIFDVYCVGSDQVWNPGNYTSLNPYFLTFTPSGKRKISYASSFGVSSLPLYARDYYKNRLQELDCISVREKSGAEIVKQVSDRNVDVVLDPTLLLTEQEWEEVEKPVDELPDRYLLIYELKKNNYLRRLAFKIAKYRGIKIVRLCSSVLPVEKDGSVLNITTAGPGGFIYLFRHADFVVTNSFHGTAFSINYGKPFYSVTSRSKSNNSRQENLLNMCGISDRLIYDDMPMPTENAYSVRIDNTRLIEMKTESEKYIKIAIK